MAAAAILGAGALGAGASIFGASKAADAQTNAASAAIANQRDMYGQNKDILAPFVKGGAGAIPGQEALLDPNNSSGPLAALMKLLMPGSDQSATLAETPGYEFAFGQGQRANNNALAARGLGGSGGAVAKGATNFAEGTASQTWKDVVAALQNSFTSRAGAGQSLINSGEAAGGAVAGVGTDTANAISGALGYQGNAQAAGANATGNAIASNAPLSMVGLTQLLQKIQGQNSGGSSGGIYNNSGSGSVGDPTQLNNLY